MAGTGRTLGALLAAPLMLAPAFASTNTLTTGVIYKGTAQNSIFCIGTNVGDSAIAEMTVSLIDTSGGVLSGVTCAPLPPGGICQASTTIASYCRIDFKGSKKAVRGSASVNSLTGNNIEVIEPAR